MPPGVDKQHPSLPRYDAPSDVIRYSNRTGFETPHPPRIRASASAK